MLAEATDAVDQAVQMAINAPEVLLCAGGLGLLLAWLLRFGGPKALASGPIRRHCIPLSVPFLLFFVWALAASLLNELAGVFGSGIDSTAVQYLALLVLNGVMIAAMLFTAHGLFARGLKGFGLNPKTLLPDAGWAAVNLTAVYPLVIAGIWLAVVVGQLFKGEAFEFPTHESLNDLAQSSRLWTQALVVLLLVAVVPVMEEMLFRGLLQTSLRGLLPGYWPAIFISSAIFTMVHAMPTHWLALFALSCAMGYAYERSGSLFRPIFIHVLFNAASVAAMLLYPEM